VRDTQCVCVYLMDRIFITRGLRLSQQRRHPRHQRLLPPADCRSPLPQKRLHQAVTPAPALVGGTLSSGADSVSSVPLAARRRRSANSVSPSGAVSASVAVATTPVGTTGVEGALLAARRNRATPAPALRTPLLNSSPGRTFVAGRAHMQGRQQHRQLLPALVPSRCPAPPRRWGLTGYHSWGQPSRCGVERRGAPRLWCLLRFGVGDMHRGLAFARHGRRCWQWRRERRARGRPLGCQHSDPHGTGCTPTDCRVWQLLDSHRSRPREHDRRCSSREGGERHGSGGGASQGDGDGARGRGRLQRQTVPDTGRLQPRCLERRQRVHRLPPPPPSNSSLVPSSLGQQHEPQSRSAPAGAVRRPSGPPPAR
jgi:hypothetical protein